MLIRGEHEIPASDTLVKKKKEILTRLLDRIEGDTYWLHGATAGQVHDLCRHSPANRGIFSRPASWGGRLGCTATGFLLKGEYDVPHASGTTKRKVKKTETVRLLATTWHALACLEWERGTSKNYVVFGFNDALDNGWGVPVKGVFEISRVYDSGKGAQNVANDWALLVVNKVDGLPTGIALAASKPDRGDHVSIVSHSLAMAKSWSDGRVVDVVDDGGVVFSHSCDTLGGSSGAPLVDSNGDVVGMAVRGGHLRSTPTGGAEPIPIGDPTEPYFGANAAVATFKGCGSGMCEALPRLDAGEGPPTPPEANPE
jgi:hypothetical protein